ncbi:MAG: hypothetical protein PUG14_03470 [Acholeplasmatales bacterium]|nr:hypothetical protein [Acholeplasmatales bacterium]MDY4016562.1 hypothetical protein [Bacilli bacterium]
MANKIYYLIHFDNKTNRNVTPSAITKGKYVASALASCSSEVEIVSLAYPTKDSQDEVYYQVSENVICHLFKGKYSNNRIIRYLNHKLYDKKIRKYLKQNVKKDDIIVVYHSLANMKLVKYIKKNITDKIVYEVEEIYGDVINDEKTKTKELKAFKNASSYIFSNDYLNSIINTKQLPYVTCYGTYEIPTLYKEAFNDNLIHCLYAGTLAQNKGALNAINVAKYLPNNYLIHILGFGSEKDIADIKNAVNEVNNSYGTTKVIYEGLKLNEEYLKFIQKCQIGLCTQNIDAAFNTTSFPSKILSYMSNGLEVVGVNIAAIKNSKVGQYIQFYNVPDEKEIANAILNINLNNKTNNVDVVKELDKEFKEDLKDMLVKYE